MEVKLKIWIEENGQLLFGRGREILLLAIKETGSLSQAAKKLNMSYRGAWGRLRASEDRLGVKLIERGGKKKRGMELTEEGRDFLEKYRMLRQETEEFLSSRAKELFG
ncbi:MAG TPA: LysR family transcriptional regulator [Syntrophaceae bacterium]|nr:LysR family transcriptional regulator [Syntrophaceae bacterium]